MKSKILSSGYTLLELIIAISIAGIVMTLALAMFTDMGKWFRSQNKQAEKVQEMIVTKKRIDQALKEISVIQNYTEKYLEYNKEGSDSLITLWVNEGVLYSGSEQICSNIKEFAFNYQIRDLLFWETELKLGGWVGGVVVLNE